eukprot:TRINITY_DN10207_c0_g1_i1.p1 TRINITY_DN10207_c0_g1~~TRINITY_DN10207_c0_g1_i1.p1  ORF type:complete len:129 (-),score=15.21 TRINITY_DN10207_c0_g1_i1:628-1014(-)
MDNQAIQRSLSSFFFTLFCVLAVLTIIQSGRQTSAPEVPVTETPSTHYNDFEDSNYRDHRGYDKPKSGIKITDTQTDEDLNVELSDDEIKPSSSGKGFGSKKRRVGEASSGYRSRTDYRSVHVAYCTS